MNDREREALAQAGRRSGGVGRWRMAVSPDGQRFLLLANATENAESEGAPSQAIVVQN